MATKTKSESPAEIAQRTGRHELTVRVAMRDGSLHAKWSERDRWQIEPQCAEAWNRGELCDHKIAARV